MSRTQWPQYTKWMIGAMALLIGAMGCGRFAPKGEPEPPDYIKISAVGLAKEVNESLPDAYAKALTGNLEARATASFDAKVADPAQQVLMARAEARRSALRLLAQTMLSVKDADGRALADLLKSSPERQAALSELLDAQASVTFEEKDQKAYAQASIKGQKVFETLTQTSTTQVKKDTELTPAQLDDRKSRAYDVALKDVKGKLKTEMMAVKLPDGRSAKEALDEDSSAARELEALIFLAQPDEVHYTGDGSCEMALFFDRNRVISIATRKYHRWMPWLSR